MRRLSLNARQAHDAANSDQVQVALIEISHPDLDGAVRLSTDPTERLGLEPLTYGTRSTWRGADPATEPFYWIVASTVLPSDKSDAPAAATLTLENLDVRTSAILRSFKDMATVSLAVVLASSPDVLEAEYTGMNLTDATMQDGDITLSFSRDQIELERFPLGTMSPATFPGLNR